ncbi:MAG: hypothetical protein NW226_25050 [Microscillaceae bacterium]|nr:hypothetical protein [Microscillaceae bacterium]
MGGDGRSGSGFAADEWGMALGYYQGDYQSRQTDSQSPPSVFDKSREIAMQPTENESLYNGNISTWVSHMDRQNPTSNRYQYDRLNRIKQSNFSVWENNQWQNGQSYATNYRYDGNGNLLELNRRDSTQILDSLVYAYETDAAGNPTNRLHSVTDRQGSTPYAKDIEGLHAYEYDPIGNLIRDRGDHNRIDWNVYGKVSEVRPDLGATADQATIHYLYDPAGNRVSKEVTMYAGTDSSQVKTTYYIRDAQGNVLSIYEKILQNGTASLHQSEIPIYGSDRLGMYLPDTNNLETVLKGLEERKLIFIMFENPH